MSGTRAPQLDLDTGAKAALDLLDRAALTTEDETGWQDHSEGIRGAISEGGLALAIRRQMDFEETLEDPDYSVGDIYSAFPADLAALAAEPEAAS